MILKLPETYRCYDHATAEYQQRMDATLACQRGRPRAYPDAIFSAVSAITTHLGGTVEATCAKITNHPDLVELIWAGVEQHARYPLTPAQQASRDAGSFPNRTTVLRTLKHRWTPEVHEQALANTAVPIALEIGHFTDGDVDDEHMHLHTDGTVLRSPTKAKTPTAVDPRTGETYPQRYDFARGSFYEAGGDPVQGTKYTFVAVRPLRNTPGSPLGLTAVDGPRPAEEYQRTIDIVTRIRGVLQRIDPCHRQRPISLVGDSAADRAQIAEMINVHNTLVTNHPHQAKARKYDQDRNVDPGIPKEHALVHLPPCTNCNRRDPLVLVGAKLVRRTPINAQLHDTPVEYRLKRVTRPKRAYYYLQYACACGTGQRIPFTRLDDEPESAYLARIALMRAWADVLTARVYSTHRGTVEGSNSQRDKKLPFKRIPAYGRPAQTAFLVAEGLGQALYALALSREQHDQHRARHPAQS